jgi:hypothetical protein
MSRILERINGNLGNEIQDYSTLSIEVAFIFAENCIREEVFRMIKEKDFSIDAIISVLEDFPKFGISPKILITELARELEIELEEDAKLYLELEGS